MNESHPEDMNTDRTGEKLFRAVGRRGLRRLDGYEKACGEAVYTRDIHLPQMLFAKILVSPFPNAKIVNMDTRKAEKIAGVKYILRYDDPEVAKWKGLHAEESDVFDLLPDAGVFEGQPLGAVAVADSEEIAEEVLKAIQIDWEERKFVLDPEAALQPDAPLARADLNPQDNRHGIGENWYYGTNYGPKPWPIVFKHGSVEDGFRESDKIIEFEVKKQYHTYAGVEAISCVARWLGDNVEIWIHHQCPDIAKKEIAQKLGLPMSKVKVYCYYQGAMFGGWAWMSWSYAPHILTSLLAKRIRRPIKLVFSSRESHFYSGNIDSGVYKVKVGARNDGKILAVKMNNVFGNGPPGWIPFLGADHLLENTAIPNLYLENRGAYINKWPVCSYRCEQSSNTLMMTLVTNYVADAVGIDPTEIAILNDGTHGKDTEFLADFKNKHGRPKRDSLKECIEAGKKAIDWNKKWHKPGKYKLPNGNYHGIGFCWTQEWLDTAGRGTAAVAVEKDGTVTISSGRADIGVSAETAYAQIVADELGVNYEAVNLRPFYDTSLFACPPAGAMALSCNGYLMKKAAKEAKAKLLELATKTGSYEKYNYKPLFEGMKAEDLDIIEGKVFYREDRSKIVSVKNLVKDLVHHGSGLEPPPVYAYAWHTQGVYLGEAATRPPLCRQAHFMEVEVDPETGDVTIIKVVNVNDVGKAVNPEACEGQQYGGTYMAVGRNKLEEMIWDKNTGVKLNANLLNYKVPTMLDCGEIETVLIETGLGWGPYGSVGIGEDVATTVDGLLSPAIYNAIGKWITEYPITPEKVLAALGKGDKVR